MMLVQLVAVALVLGNRVSAYPQDRLMPVLNGATTPNVIALKVHEYLTSDMALDDPTFRQERDTSYVQNRDLFGLFFRKMGPQNRIYVAWPNNHQIKTKEDAIVEANRLAKALRMNKQEDSNSTLFLFENMFRHRSARLVDELCKRVEDNKNMTCTFMVGDSIGSRDNEGWIDDTGMVAMRICGPSVTSWSVTIHPFSNLNKMYQKLLELKKKVTLQHYSTGVLHSLKCSHLNCFHNEHPCGDSYKLMRLVRHMFPQVRFVGLFNKYTFIPRQLLLDDPDDQESEEYKLNGAPVAQQDKSGYEDSVAAASETGGAEEAYDDGDDSDMYMEPDGAESSQAASRHEAQPETQQSSSHQPDAPHQEQTSAAPHPRVSIVAVRPVQTSIHVTSSESSESSKAAEPEEKSLETDSQNFFPSFAELFGNHRLPFTEHQQQQQRYRPSRFLGYFQRDRPYAVAASSNKEPALLGSGNFGVITGGTYYPEEKENDEYSIDETAYSPFYHGRGRSNYYKNPKPQPVRPGDFFANFRDFADITAPPKSSFSHLSVVYAAKNGSSATRLEQPRNIIETLRMLEEQEEQEQAEGAAEAASSSPEPPQKKLSQGKRKLHKLKKYQEEKARKSRMTVEPLLALS